MKLKYFKVVLFLPIILFLGCKSQSQKPEPVKEKVEITSQTPKNWADLKWITGLCNSLPAPSADCTKVLSQFKITQVTAEICSNSRNPLKVSAPSSQVEFIHCATEFSYFNFMPEEYDICYVFSKVNDRIMCMQDLHTGIYANLALRACIPYLESPRAADSTFKSQEQDFSRACLVSIRNKLYASDILETCSKKATGNRILCFSEGRLTAEAIQEKHALSEKINACQRKGLNLKQAINRTIAAETVDTSGRQILMQISTEAPAFNEPVPSSAEPVVQFDKIIRNCEISFADLIKNLLPLYNDSERLKISKSNLQSGLDNKEIETTKSPE